MLRPGDRIDIWVIDKRLGTGGMGSVYRCHNHAAPRILAAIKVLDGPVSRSPEARARFIREAEILFTLDHPNIVKVRNIRVDQDLPYIEMEFVEGESLEDRLSRKGALPVERAVPLARQLAAAVAHLHGLGIRHRDIKPANLLIDKDGTARLVDFGLAMEADVSRLTQGNMSFGTVSYAPPEWIDPTRLDPVQWDLYAIGVVLWEMLTGAVAFPVTGQGDARQQAFQVVLQKQNHEPLDPGEAFPEGLRSLIRDLTRSTPEERLSSASALVERLAALRIDPPERFASSGPTPLSPGGRSRAPVPPPPTTLGGPSVVPRPEGRTTVPRDRTATWSADELDPITAPIDPPSLPPRRRGALGLVAAAIAALLALGVLALVLGVGWLWWSQNYRPVDLQVSGLPADLPFDALLDERAPARLTADLASFTSIRAGSHELFWVVGEGCEAAPCARGQCPEWCLTGGETLEIPPGEGTHVASVTLTAPPPRPLRVELSESAGSYPVTIRVEGLDASSRDGVLTVARAAPGRYQARVTLGRCPAEAPPCEGRCPPGCRDVVRDLTVPVGRGPHEVKLLVDPPEPAARAPRPAPQRPEPATPAPTPEPEPPSAPDPAPVAPEPAPTEPASTEPAPTEPDPAPAPTSGRLVTAREFARWLASNTDWQPEAARASGAADQAYLFGWNGLEPPADQADRPVQNVPHLAARAYCQGRGGLPQVDAPPRSWDEASVGLGYEWRLQGQTPAIIESNGTPSTMVRRGQALLGTGFRCAR